MGGGLPHWPGIHVTHCAGRLDYDVFVVNAAEGTFSVWFVCLSAQKLPG